MTSWRKGRVERESDGKHDGKPQFGKAWLVGQLQAAGAGSPEEPDFCTPFPHTGYSIQQKSPATSIISCWNVKKKSSLSIRLFLSQIVQSVYPLNRCQWAPVDLCKGGEKSSLTGKQGWKKVTAGLCCWEDCGSLSLQGMVGGVYCFTASFSHSPCLPLSDYRFRKGVILIQNDILRDFVLWDQTKLEWPYTYIKKYSYNLLTLTCFGLNDWIYFFNWFWKMNTSLFCFLSSISHNLYMYLFFQTWWRCGWNC